MAEMVSSAIVGEAVSRIFSGIASTSKEENNSTEEAIGGDGLERLEMARIKMEAALETSNKWQITDSSLLRWRKKLKRAAEDCDDAARRCRQLSQKKDEAEQVVRQSSYSKRIAHATKAFICSFVGGGNDECSTGSTTTTTSVQRFERLADGASEFMRYVQLGGTPRQHLFFDPLIGHIFAGKSLLYRVLQPGGQLHLFGICPMSFEERGLEATLSFTYLDPLVPMNNFRLGVMLRLSESTDIIGTTVKCLRQVTPHFKSTAEIVIKEITQLPSQDFVSVPRANAHLEPWNDIHTTLTRWFRPDPLCCQGYESHDVVPSCGGGGSANKLTNSSLLPEPVCLVYLQRQISLHQCNNFLLGSAATAGYDGTSAFLESFPPLRLGIIFMPHQCLEDPESTCEGSVVEAINGEKQQLTYVNVHLDQLDEMLLPKAIDYLHHNTNATNYQICWRSNHGSAHLYVEKNVILRAFIGRRTTRHVIYKMLRQNQENQQLRKVQLKQVGGDLLKLWVVRSSERMRNLVSAWVQ